MEIKVINEQHMALTVSRDPFCRVSFDQGQSGQLFEAKESSCQVKMLRIQFDTNGVPDRQEVVALVDRCATTNAQDQC